MGSAASYSCLVLLLPALPCVVRAAAGSLALALPVSDHLPALSCPPSFVCAQFDKWKVDVAVTGSQKALSLPTGLAFVCASEKVSKALYAGAGCYDDGVNCGSCGVMGCLKS